MGERNKRVFELMRERNLRKVDIAECLGISKSAVTQWEKKGTDPTYEQCVELSKLFDVNVDYLFSGSETPFDRKVSFGYFLDPETITYVEELRNNPELKAVFDVARDMPKEKLEAIYNVLKQME